MNLHWKVLIFFAMAAVLSLSPLAVTAGPTPDGPTCERVIVIQGDGPEGDFLSLAEAGKPVRKEKRFIVTAREDGRPRLGLVLRMEKSAKTDPLGAYVQAVTPGSPADDAGMKVGDIVVKFDGKPLAGADSGAEDEDSGPAAKLVGLARDLKEGDAVVLEVRRGDRTLSLEVTPRPLSGKEPFEWTGKLPEEFDFESFGDLSDLGHFPGMAFICREWLDMELVALDRDLGEYFGTTEGLLVVKAPEASLGIKSGDIIQKVGDRKPTSPSQAFRILRSYEPGETVNLDVLRKQKHLPLQVTVPEQKADSDERILRFRAPAPPPTPPATGVRRG